MNFKRMIFAMSLGLIMGGAVSIKEMYVSADNNTNANVNVNINNNSSNSSAANSSSDSVGSSSSSEVTLSQPILTLGTSLTSSERSEVAQTLENAANVDSSNVQAITIDGADLVQYLNPSGDSFTDNSGVWSSALIQKTDNGGINVQIVDYNGSNNITTITQNQYRNAALTAGITNANIYVTSPRSIDGSGALAGVYAAYSAAGNSLSQKNINNAQNEQNLLSSITQANKGKDGYTDSQLNNAVAGAKQEIADTKNPASLSRQEIADIVDKELKKNELNNVLTQNQKNKIISLLQKIAASGVMNRQSFKDQAGKLSQNIQANAKNIFNKLKNDKGLWAKVKQFFSNIVTDLRNLF
ncbi:DUF1002 domain-containing protein [Liquorilactobacillus sicerae]|uniref:DUF1002 domain-containing protein n=1 Tax=Liquorilactobacillus sicerae TaxID=1416943 RepID=UPI0024816673|nr:DUF1002 domain-containing protein [Liquorilactobacillus sicerae]